MQAAQVWRKLFNKRHLEEHYYEKIEAKPSIGIDNITPQKFKQELNENVDIIYKKVNNGTYHFTRYKQLLFLKGSNKIPRVVCVPTLRDKLVVSVLNEMLNKVYKDNCKTKLPQTLIDDICRNISNYDYFIKLDIKAFYASIDQDILLKKLRKKIRKSVIIDLITKAIKTTTFSYLTKEKNEIIRDRGIPEGLSISNTLANIYLMDLDKKYSTNENIRYWRYVDDILILVNKDMFEKIKLDISCDIKKLNLEINDKKDEGKVWNGFEYLGYKISTNIITVRDSGILKIEQSIETLFRQIKNNNIDYIQWKLNLKITGFIWNKNKYGWLFFYSQITDLNLLFHLDDIVKKLMERYKVKESFKVKRFVRAYFEIRKALSKTKYIPNIDQYEVSDKKKILVEVCGLDLSKLTDEKIEINFKKIMSKEIRDIEKDIQSIS